ncbi:PAS domain-containing sensor histidine kinase [Candidatus Wolfebacteria bacterium]|nr:PAS domain-containing sensor histidine kinase [Candidatus Wolfebacteria bacterium]
MPPENREHRGLNPLLAALISLALFVFLTVLGWRVISDEFIRRAIVPGASASLEEMLLSAVLVGGIVIAFLVSLVVYLLLASRRRGERYAERLTHDLAASRQEFRQLYEHSPVPYLLLDSDGTISQPNYAALHLLGYASEELTGKNFFTLLTAEDDPPAQAGAVSPEEVKERFMRSVAVTHEDVRVVTKVGAKRWALLSIFQIGGGRRARRGLATLVDVTEQKEIDRAKTEFVSIASHQLKTPLSTTNWYVELLRNSATGTLNEKQRDYIEKINVWNHRMVELVEMLLNVSRIEMGTLQAVRESVVPNALIRSVLDELAPQTTEKKIVVTYDPATAVEAFQSDPRLLRIAIQNLVSNAVKYTPKGGSVQITVDSSGDTIQVIVADSGYGIPPEAQDKIFTKMFRADNARKIDTKGTGLGLYLSKSFIEALGGTMSFTSVLGEGSVFTITLPRR